MEISVVGIDLAKEVFQLHGNDRNGKTIFRKKLRRAELKKTVATLPACTIAMEACATAHYWAREFRAMGHEVRLISPQFVKPFVKSNKNDANDAEAIAEAVVRPNMRFVSIKETWQQDMQCLHRVRERLVKNRTALMNELRGLLGEYGVHIGKGRAAIRKELPERDSSQTGHLLTPRVSMLARLLLDELREIEERLETLNREIEHDFENFEACKRIAKIPGIGPITSTALVAAIGDPRSFKNGRQMSAWLGLVPRQNSSGGKTVLQGISKRGDGYLRKLLIHGARSAVRYAALRDTKRNQWILEKVRTRGTNKACVALANHNARIVWALLAKQEEYQAA